MGSVHLDRKGKSMGAMPVKQFSRSECKWLRAPRKLPRVGDEFQVELPPLSAELNLVNARYRADYRHKSFIGLPNIPVTCSNPKHDTQFKGETYSGEAHNLLVPGVCSEHWSDDDKSSFLFGLYIFLRKNFVELRQFVESKDMDTVLSYYYGEFYSSPEYRIWSDWRKTKSKKVAYGKSLFSGLRHQKILSHLLRPMSEDRQDALLEVSQKFGGKKISLLDYVSTLKTMVGINKLVEAVGIVTGIRGLIGSISTVQFTVMDTSLSGSIIRESKGLPVETLNSSTAQNRIDNGCKNASDEITDESETTKSGPEISDKSIGELKHKKEFHEKNQMKKVAKSLSGKKMNRVCTDIIAPNSKRGRQLTSGNWEETDNANGNAQVSSRGNESLLLNDFHLPQVSMELEYQIPEQIEAPCSSGGNEHMLLMDLNLPQVCQELENQIPEQNDVPSSSLGNESPLSIDLNLPQVCQELENQIREQHDVPSSSLGNESALLIDLNMPQVSQEFDNQILEQNDVPGSSLANESPLLIDRNLPQVSHELENQISEQNDAPGSSCGNESPLLIDLNLPQVSLELENQMPEQNYVAGSSCRNESGLLIDLNLPLVSSELDYQILEQNNPRLPNSSAMEAGIELQVTEARLEQQPTVNSRRHSTRSRPPTTRALEALANGDLTVNRRTENKKRSSRDETVPRPLQRARLARKSGVISEAEESVSKDGLDNTRS